jgi:hypothetical protein
MKDYKKYLNPANKVPMIEILGNNSIVRIVNNTQKKISIKHYLNTYLFPIGETESKELLFPLYYRVIFNRQSVKIKSNIKTPFPESKFKIESLSEIDKLLLEREALALTYIIDEIYNNVRVSKMRDETALIEQRVEDEFDINQIFGSFKYSDFELPAVINRLLLKKIQENSVLLKENQEVDKFLNRSENLNAFQLLQFLKAQSSEWEIFETKFHPQIWFFDLHYFNFLDFTDLYNDLGATVIDVLYIDFNEKFMSYCEESNLIGLSNEVIRLIRP